MARRDAEVLRLRTEGLTFDEIAQLSGYKSRSGALKAYRRALLRLPDEVRDARMLRQARIEELIKGLWPVAEDSSHPDQFRAIEQIRRLMQDLET